MCADLSEELLEEGSGERVPCDCVCDGCEDPVELSQWGFAVRLLAWYAVNQVTGEAFAAQQALGAEPAQRHLHIQKLSSPTGETPSLGVQESSS